jgi:hypothetical protein
MKKTVILLLALLSWQLVQADVVTVDQARLRAAQFFTAAEVQTKATAVRPDDFKLIGTFPDVATKSSSDAPAMYIFERSSGGYAIVSGDDVARPVLGYSLKGHFPVSDMPDNMRAMLQWYADIIAYAREQGWETASDEETDSGLDPANSVQLQTAKWDQGHPFNDLVPEINGLKPPIGCVATAIAIVMKYHKWPHRGTGTLPSYDYWLGGQNNPYHVEGFALGHEYDWEKMPDDYHNCSEEESAQIARLLYDVAVMCRMGFAPHGSSSSISRAQLLPEFFGYDKSMRRYIRGEYSPDNGYDNLRWEKLVSAEIDAGRPVLYSGGSSDGGHAFVIDGYNGRYFSINYGWSGGSSWREGHDRSNAFKDFYTLSPIDGHEEDLLDFDRDQDVITRIFPDEGGIEDPSISVIGRNNLPFIFKVGEEFYLTSIFANEGPVSATREFRLALFDADGNMKEVISSVKNIIVSAYEVCFEDFACKITKQIKAGDRILLCMNEKRSGQWVPIFQPRWATIVFTDKPLSEIVEIGYSENPAHPDLSNPERKRDVCMKLGYDVLWELLREDDSILPFSNMGNNVSMDGSDFSVASDLSDNDMIAYDIWFRPGKYTLRLRNPTTNEKMEIKLEL